MYYELHITMERTERGSSQVAVEKRGWKFSCIAGDPDLGLGEREYATWHESSGHEFIDVRDFLNASANAFRELGFKVVRRKIELVMYDTKGRERT
jgi:hypothetical protein